jgi:hypothetical protein
MCVPSFNPAFALLMRTPVDTTFVVMDDGMQRADLNRFDGLTFSQVETEIAIWLSSAIGSTAGSNNLNRRFLIAW